MKSFNLKPRQFGFLVGTRAALAFGVGCWSRVAYPKAAASASGWPSSGLGAVDHGPRHQAAASQPDGAEPHQRYALGVRRVRFRAAI